MTADSDPSTGLADFQALRPRLFGIAYRMLGSATDAEDVLQDAWLRWQTVDRSTVRSPRRRRPIPPSGGVPTWGR